MLSEYFGVARPPVVVRMIEDMPVITDFLDPSMAKTAGAEIGDVILKVDGEDARSRIERYARYLAASTPQSQLLGATLRFLGGPEGTLATMTVRDKEDHVKDISLTRKIKHVGGSNNWRSGPVLRLLPHNIGYADLDRLRASEVDRMFEKFRKTRAIIFDVRGYPRGTAWSIAPRLTEENGVAAARFDRPMALAPEGHSSDISGEVTRDYFVQTLPHTDQWRYKGKTVMLIDERTISQAEHTGLFFEAANGTHFVGSPTAGANGDVTNFTVPGGISLMFSGQGVRHADGRQLQRIGLVPDVEVKPTIAGIRAGRDEVLERAVEYLNGSLPAISERGRGGSAGKR